MNAVRLRSGAGPEAVDYLDRNDAYNFFRPLGTCWYRAHLHQRSFITGTVFSDLVAAKLGVFSDAQAQGCTVYLIFIGICLPQRSDERVEPGRFTMEAEALPP